MNFFSKLFKTKLSLKEQRENQQSILIDACLKNKYYQPSSPPCEDCCICLEDIEDETDLTRTKCNHTYHTNCINEWLENHNTCPLCRSELSEPFIDLRHIRGLDWRDRDSEAPHFRENIFAVNIDELIPGEQEYVRRLREIYEREDRERLRNGWDEMRARERQEVEEHIRQDRREREEDIMERYDYNLRQRQQRRREARARGMRQRNERRRERERLDGAIWYNRQARFFDTGEVEDLG